MEAQMDCDCPRYGDQHKDGNILRDGNNSRDVNHMKPSVTVCRDTLYAGSRVDSAE